MDAGMNLSSILEEGIVGTCVNRHFYITGEVQKMGKIL
jgi:hypothetical protein